MSRQQRMNPRVGTLIVVAASVIGCSCSSPGQPSPPPTTGPGVVSGVCGYTVPQSETSRSVPADGGTVSIRVLTDVASAVGCTWSVSVADDSRAFVRVIDPPTGSSAASNATVTLDVAVNNGAGRTGNVTVAGVPFRLVQPDAPCVLTLSGDLNASFPAAGGTGHIGVARTRGNVCAWTATSGSGFVTIDSGASGTNDGTVSFVVGRNNDQARTGTVTIAGQTITVSQSAGLVLPTITAARVGDHFEIMGTGFTPGGLARFCSILTPSGQASLPVLCGPDQPNRLAGDGTIQPPFQVFLGIPGVQEFWVVDVSTNRTSNHVNLVSF